MARAEAKTLENLVQYRAKCIGNKAIKVSVAGGRLSAVEVGECVSGTEPARVQLWH